MEIEGFFETDNSTLEENIQRDYTKIR